MRKVLCVMAVVITFAVVCDSFTDAHLRRRVSYCPVPTREPITILYPRTWNGALDNAVPGGGFFYAWGDKTEEVGKVKAEVRDFADAVTLANGTLLSADTAPRWSFHFNHPLPLNQNLWLKITDDSDPPLSKKRLIRIEP